MTLLPDSFPEGTTFSEVMGVPVSRAPTGRLSAWDFNPMTGEKPPRIFSVQTWTSEGVPISEEEFRKLVATAARH